MSDRADEAWDKAAACQAHAEAATDSKLKAMFLKLRQSWIRIGNDAQLQRDTQANAQRLDRADRAPKL
jgi:hypothetical protein